MNNRRGPEGPVIAIDGPSGSGKSTVSRNVARRLGFKYVDTGAMYRAFAVAAYESGIEPDDDDRLRNFAQDVDIDFDEEGRILVNGKDYTGSIRTPLADRLSSIVSAKPFVRQRLVELQRRIGEHGYVIMEGRDISTVVFPDAHVKIYMVASADVRAERRYLQLIEKGQTGVSKEEILKAIIERDRRDSQRKHSPLRQAEDAVVIDTSRMTLEEVEEEVLCLIERGIGR